MSSTASRLRAVVAGRVQGVGFRQFVQREATHLDLAGYVRNRPDGTVEVVAEGVQEALGVFVDRLRQGPRSASVSSVGVDWLAATGEFRFFNVRF
jgi:acylphosphatase